MQTELEIGYDNHRRLISYNRGSENKKDMRRLWNELFYNHG